MAGSVGSMVVNGLISLFACYLVIIVSLVVMGAVAKKMGWAKERRRVPLPKHL